jgi:hypothetical protein
MVLPIETTLCYRSDSIEICVSAFRLVNGTSQPIESMMSQRTTPAILLGFMTGAAFALKMAIMLHNRKKLLQ